MGKERRKPPGPKLRAKFASNRIRRRFLELRVQELTEEMETATTAKKALEAGLERERVKLRIKQLPIRRKPKKKKDNSTGSTSVFGGLF